MSTRLQLALAAIPLLLPGVSRGEGTYEKMVLPFFEEHCLECHDRETAKGDLDLEGCDPDLLRGDDLETWRLIVEQLQFREMPPEKEEQPAEAERMAILSWIRGELLKTQRPGAEVALGEKLAHPEFGNYVDHEFLFTERLPFTVPAQPRIWRLRPAIYDSVFPRHGEGVKGLANGLSTLDGPVFKDYAAPYFLDEAATVPLLGNAKKIAAALVGPRSKDRQFKELVAEEPPTEEQISAAIGHAFRKIVGRSATGRETDRLLGFHRQATVTGGHRTAGRALLTAVLMQPEVLFRSELGDGSVDEHGRTRLAPKEIAYALSYALDDRPIDTLLKAAAEGQLASIEGIATVLEPLLQDDSNRQQRNPRLFQFFREYLGYPMAADVFEDQPEGGQHEAGRLIGDLEMTIADILKADVEVLRSLLTTRSFYVNTTWGSKQRSDELVSRHVKRGSYHTAFNLPPDWRWSPHLQPLEFPEGERAGVLTHPAWLAAWSGNFDNHPVQRGKWIRTHLLGGTVPDVPIGVDARVPEDDARTFRDRLHEATGPAECWRCHRKMDELGVVFERYDHYGRLQRIEAGQEVVPSGRITRTGIPELDGREVAGPAELMEILSRSEHVEQVFVRHAFRYFLGRNETLGDANTLQDARRAYREAGGSFRALVLSLLTSDSFLLRQTNPNRPSP